MDVNQGNVLYHKLIDAWNHRDATAFANLFAIESICVGYDGSEMNGRNSIAAELSKIFAGHETARYVAIVRETKLLANDTVLLRAHVGMIQPNQTKVESNRNAIQIMIARLQNRSGEIISFQNTPAQYHGRPDDLATLTAELQQMADNS
jgi:uncharacterized protein (TIGR02246 family)